MTMVKVVDRYLRPWGAERSTVINVTAWQLDGHDLSWDQKRRVKDMRAAGWDARLGDWLVRRNDKYHGEAWLIMSDEYFKLCYGEQFNA